MQHGRVSKQMILITVLPNRKAVKTATRFSKMMLGCFWCHSIFRYMSDVKYDMIKSLQYYILKLQCQLVD
jgi:uncharacterized C2H2 Zn-finger protein